MCCPLCRAKFGRGFAPVVDQSMQKTIKEETGEAFEKRRAELIRAGQWVGSKKLMRFSYGNTYTRVQDAPLAFPEDSSCKLKLEHSWAMFVILTEDRQKSEYYIKSVTYHVPRIDKASGGPLYKEEREKVRVTKQPFVLSRDSSSPFFIELDIEFHEWTQVEPQHVVYKLKFEGKGDH